MCIRDRNGRQAGRLADLQAGRRASGEGEVFLSVLPWGGPPDIAGCCQDSACVRPTPSKAPPAEYEPCKRADMLRNRTRKDRVSCLLLVVWSGDLRQDARLCVALAFKDSTRLQTAVQPTQPRPKIAQAKDQVGAFMAASACVCVSHSNARRLPPLL